MAELVEHGSTDGFCPKCYGGEKHRQHCEPSAYFMGEPAEVDYLAVLCADCGYEIGREKCSDWTPERQKAADERYAAREAYIVRHSAGDGGL
jgi:hypothetical protein